MLGYSMLNNWFYWTAQLHASVSDAAQIESFLIIGLFSTPRSNLFKWSDGHTAETDLVLQQEDWESKTTLPLLDSILFHRFPLESCVYVCESSNHLHFVTWQENTLRLDLSRGFSYLLSVFVESSRKLPQSSPAGPCWSGSPRRRWTHCSHLAFSSLSTSAKKNKKQKLASHNKAGSSPASGGPGFLSPGRAQRNKLLLRACQWVWCLNRLLWSQN